jgi:hypothetical protein
LTRKDVRRVIGQAALPLAAGSLEQQALAVVAREQAVLVADHEGVAGNSWTT